MLARHERILKVDLQHLNEQFIQEVLIEWKDYPKDEVTWDLENEFKVPYPNFVNADNDLIGEGRSIMD